jgi:hypothetical protein
MVRSCAGGRIARGLRYGVSQIGDVVGEVGWLAQAAARRVVFSQANSWCDGDLRERRMKAWMGGFLAAGCERSRRLGELSAFGGEFLCHHEFSSGTEQAE